MITRSVDGMEYVYSDSMDTMIPHYVWYQGVRYEWNETDFVYYGPDEDYLFYDTAMEIADLAGY